MNDPRQYLVHLTSRGESVQTNNDGEVANFICHTRQPMKDINKFGLLHYSIPKQLDTLQANNCTFNLRITFGAAVLGQAIDAVIPVTIPQLDYYSSRVSFRVDMAGDSGGGAANPEGGGQFRSKAIAAFDEVLQTSINWSIQRYYGRLRAAAGFAGALRVCDRALARLSCVVFFNRETGCFNFYFGYRGSTNIIHPGNWNQGYDPSSAVPPMMEENRSRTGSPCATNDDFTDPNARLIFTDGRYSFLDVNGTEHDQERITAGQFPTIVEYEQMRIVSVSFENLSMRLQLMMGSPAANIVSNEQVPLENPQNLATIGRSITRGWVRLINYPVADGQAGTHGRLGLLRMNMSIPPNLAGPSFLFLQLTAQGTRTKILGRTDERGGWAVPTAPNQWMSNFDNFPQGDGFEQFGAKAVRTMPIVETLVDFRAFYATRHNLGGQNDGLGYDFDPIVHAAAVPEHGNNWQMNIMHNFCLDRTAVNIGRHIIFQNVAPAHKLPYRGRNGLGSQAFGNGNFRLSQVFTVSLIEPNWIFCQVENSTVQTLDVQMLWGDTSEAVEAVQGNPTQFSIIASP